jgi:hypothetical protein
MGRSRGVAVYEALRGANQGSLGREPGSHHIDNQYGGQSLGGGDVASEMVGARASVSVVWWLSVAATVIGAVLLVVVAIRAMRGRALTLDFYFQLLSSAYHISSARLGGSAGGITLDAAIARRCPQCTAQLTVSQ